MQRGPIYKKSYKPQFSGHETFPVRYGWLKKAFDRVAETEADGNNRVLCWGDDAIARFGVGKNMVSAIRHWAKTMGVIDEPSTNDVVTTQFGRFLFGDEGLDPFMENPASLWLLHWKLASFPQKTLWYWVFGYYPAQYFERADLVRHVERLILEREWTPVALKTITNDIACFIRTYVVSSRTSKTNQDDALESPLIELGLIKSTDRSDGFRFARGPKTNLGDGVFAYALIDFWSRYSDMQTLSFEAIAHEPGSPGRVFQLDENDVIDRLVAMEAATEGRIKWSETAGLKQVVRSSEIDVERALNFTRLDFEFRKREVA